MTSRTSSMSRDTGANADTNSSSRTSAKPSSIRPVTPMDPSLAPISCSSPSTSRPNSALTSATPTLPPIELNNGTPRKAHTPMTGGTRSFSRMSLEEDLEGSQGPPGTPGSVASGRVGRGTFFTAMARDWGGAAEHGEEQDDDGQSVASELSQFGDPADGGWAGQSSQGFVNPMQSPSASFDIDEPLDPEQAAYMNAYEDEGAGGNPHGNPPLASTEFSALNPMATPRDSQAVDRLVVFHPEDPPEGPDSLMSMLHDLYDFNKEEETEGGDHEEEEEEGPSGLAVTTDLMAEGRLDQVMEEQQQRRQELGDYLSQLEGLTDEEGSKLVDLPRNYLAIVEGMIRKQRGESSMNQGWLGPRRFEDLPIHKLPDSHSDPAVELGLGKIRELDSRLQDRTLEALIVARETYPQKWAEEEQRRMERHALRVEEALKKERMKRMRVGRISRAFTSLLEATTEEDNGTGQTPAVVEPYASRYLQLRPEEEVLVESILARRDEDEEVNPFDVSLALTADQGKRDPRDPMALPDLDLPLDGALALIPRSDESVPTMTLATINAKLEQYALAHEWAADGSLIDFAAARPSNAGSHPRPSSPTGSVLSSASKISSQVSKPPKSIKSPQAGRGGTADNASSVGGTGSRDYLREQREAKELEEKEKDLDARIRAFKTSDPKVSLTRDQLFLLVEECRRLESLQHERLKKLEEERDQIQKQAATKVHKGVKKSNEGSGRRSASSSMDGSAGGATGVGGEGGAEAVGRIKSAGNASGGAGGANRKQAIGISTAIKAGFLPPLTPPRK